MSKLNALIVDDESNARDNLKILLEEYCPEINVLGSSESAESARKFIEKSQPNVVFLDIAMPKEDGFALLKSYEDRNFSVVFTTAYNEYALKALKERAIDYLEKPISIEDLQNSVQKLVKQQETQKETENANVNAFIEEMMYAKQNDRISVPTRNGYVIIRNEDIVHLEASDNYTMLYLADGSRQLSSKNIKVYEENLHPDIFFRTHKSHIINIENHLKEFSRSQGNLAVLTNGKTVPISRRKMASFLERINTF